MVAVAAVPSRNPLERQVVGLGRARGKNNLTRRRADQRRHLFTGRFDQLGRGPTKSMAHARRITEVIALDFM
jgi:hypothetical protein